MVKGKILGFLSAIALGANILSPSINANAALVGYKGDIDQNMTVDSSDVKLLSHHVLTDSNLNYTQFTFADMDSDSNLNAVDLCLIKRVYTGIDTLSEIFSEKELIEAPLAAIDASCPTTGDVKMLVFQIEFTDCTNSTSFSAQAVEQAVFGPEDTSSSYYPYESVTAFLDRSSYGALNMTGDVYTYTAKSPISDYNEDKVKLVEEILDYFEESVDFSEYDADSDGMIDCSAYFVPSSADSNYWWPCSGAFGDPSYTVDGVYVGNIITGNSSPESHTDYVTTIIHEMGHTMGLPDYYNYSGTDDWQGLNGDAGYEMMDDAYCDFSSFSKLMLGWYTQNDFYIYDESIGTQTFSIASSQHEPDFILIPGKTLGDDYFGEYFIVEYITADENNTLWWNTNSGIRIIHVQSEIYTYDYWNISVFAYDNYGPLYAGDDGIRIVRLVNDGNGFFDTGDVINSQTPGFAWYDSDGQQTVDTGLTIKIGDLSDGKYSITISNAN